MSRQARSLVLVLAAALSGCIGAPSSALPQTVETTSGATASVPTAVPSTASSPAETPTSATTPFPVPSMAVLAPDSVAITVESDVRMRSKPEVSSTSAIYSPTVPKGVELFVLGGPVRESGYDWYEVQPLKAGFPTHGWVASGSRTGEPWIVPASATCPKAPTTIAGLVEATSGMRLACFSRVPITVKARLLPCNCSVDPAYTWEPAWFGGGYAPSSAEARGLGGGLLVLADPAAAAPLQSELLVFLTLDPSGTYPNPLPVGDAVEVAGMFDHPAARGCTATLESEPEVRSDDVCRTSFAVTSMR